MDIKSVCIGGHDAHAANDTFFGGEDFHHMSKRLLAPSGGMVKQENKVFYFKVLLLDLLDMTLLEIMQIQLHPLPPEDVNTFLNMTVIL